MTSSKDIKLNPEKYLEALRRRGPKFAKLYHDFAAALNSTDSTAQQKLENFQATINQGNKVIPTLSGDEKKKKIAELKIVSDAISSLKKSQTINQLPDIPNIPLADVPAGGDETGNIVLHEVGQKPKLTKPEDYMTLAENLDVIDVKRAAKVSGSRFGYIKGDLARLEFALVQYATNQLVASGFQMVLPPVMIKEENMDAMGYLSGGGESETYHLQKDGLYLVGTSEQSIGPMHRDESFTSSELPRRYLAYSTCFRREAGSYGKDTKGILRVHQFNKLEMFSITLPENSDQEHEWLLAQSELLWQGLKVPYRVVKLCAGDLGWASARTYDIEAWLPGQNTYREMGSISTTTDYQSRRLKITVQEAGTKQYAHLLNGTAFSERALIAIMENYQAPDGSITIPEVLRPWMGGQERMRR